jgi:hypothetical protein
MKLNFLHSPAALSLLGSRKGDREAMAFLNFVSLQANPDMATWIT